MSRTVADALPSVTLVRVGDVIGQVGELIGRIALAIRVAAAATVLAGIAVLVGAVAASARTRRADATVLKLLGATRAQVLGAQMVEYGLLSALLAAVSLLVGLGAAWFAVTKLFELPWAPDWGVVAATLGLATATTMAVGVLGNLRRCGSARPKRSATPRPFRRARA